MKTISFIIFASLIPFLWLFTQIHILGNFSFAFANISGFIGATFLLWEFILGIRELAKKFKFNQADSMKLHIFLGVWGMFFVLIHPILEMFSYAESILFLFIPDFSSQFKTQVTLGRFAFIITLLIWITSAFVRNKLSYKQWIWVHYLSYIMMFFVFIHALDIGTFLNTFILIKIYWFILLGVYVLLVIWRLNSFIRRLTSHFPQHES